MPNWCHNSTVIRVPSSVVPDIDEARRILDDFENRYTYMIGMDERRSFSLDTIRPIPLSVRFSDDPSDRIRWCVDNWGTKWDVHNPAYDRTMMRSALMAYDTAWEPPLEALRHLSTLFPQMDISTSYNDEYDNFNGYYIVHDNGSVVANTRREGGSSCVSDCPECFPVDDLQSEPETPDFFSNAPSARENIRSRGTQQFDDMEE